MAKVSIGLSYEPITDSLAKGFIVLKAQREQYIPKLRALQIFFEPGWFIFSLPFIYTHKVRPPRDI